MKATCATARLLSQCLQERLLPLSQNNSEFGLRCKADGSDSILIEGTVEGVEKAAKVTGKIKEQMASPVSHPDVRVPQLLRI